MKVAIVLNTSWNIYNFRMGLIKTLQAQGHEIHTIAPHDKYSDSLVEAGCHYHKVTMDSRGANPIKDLALSFELYFIYKRIQPDVILHYTIKPNIYGTFAAHALGIPCVNNVCGLGTVFLKDNFVSWVAKSMYKLAFKFPKKIFFQNPQDQEFFIKTKLAPREVTDLIQGSGIDSNKFAPLKNHQKQGKKFTFLLISRLIYDKGVVEYVQAIEKLKEEGFDADFQILGPKDPLHKRGISLEKIDGWINSNSINYLGTTDDVRPFIQNADCVVLPSYREGTPRTLLEAAGMEKPIVATDVPGCNNVVEHKHNGLLCNMKDSDDLAEKMRAMMQLPAEVREEMGKKGRAKVMCEFNEKLVIEKYVEVIGTVNPV